MAKKAKSSGKGKVAKAKKVSKAKSKQMAKPAVKQAAKPAIQQPVRQQPTRQNSTNYIHTDVPEDKVFYLCDGSTIKNIKEFEESLERMPDDVYNYHCSQEKNDFAKWIHDVTGETRLAENLIHKSKNEARMEVVKHIIKNI